MANIAKLNVMLVANSSGLTRGLTKARTSVVSFSRRIGGLASSIGGVLSSAIKRGAIALGAVGAGLVYVGAKTADGIDTQAKMARRLGITYKELKALEYASGLAGIGTEELNKAFEKMLDTVGAAKLGEGTAVDAFRQIGISVEDLNRMKPENQFRAIAAAINNIKDPSVKLAATRDIFGRGGGAILELFAGGNKALAEAAGKIETFGLALSGLDTSNIEFMNDRLGDVKSIFEGIATQITAFVSPYIGQLAADTIAWVEELGGVDAIVAGGLTKMGGVLDNILGFTTNLQAAWRVLGDIVGAVVGTITDLWNSIPAPIRKLLTMNPIRDLVLFGKTPEVDSGTGGIVGDFKRKKQDIKTESGGRTYSGLIGDFAAKARSNADIRLNGTEEEQRARVQRDHDAWREARLQREREAAYMRHPEWFTVTPKGVDPQEYKRSQGIASQMQQYPDWFRGAGAGRGSANGGALSDEDRQLLRTIATNTGRNTIAYSG